MNFLICICRKKSTGFVAFDVNYGDDSDNESDDKIGEDEEITHFVGSKNIGAAHEKDNNQDNLEQAYIALWEDKIVQVYIRLLFGWIKRHLLWISIWRRLDSCWLIIMHYCFRIIQVSTLLWLQEIYIIDACVEHIKYRADIFSIRCF